MSTTLTTKSTRPFHPWASGAIILAVSAGAYGLLLAAEHSPALPYNLRELLPIRHRWAHRAVLAVTMAMIGVLPAWAGRWVAWRGIGAMVPLAAAGVGLGIWFPLRFAVTEESLWDIVGSPILGWGGGWEMLLRFLALQGLLMAPLIAAYAALDRPGRGADDPDGCRGPSVLSLGVWTGAAMVLCWLVVVRWAATDNLTELLRARPAGWVGPLLLTPWLAILSTSAAALAWTGAASNRPGRWWVAPAVLVGVGPAFGLLWWGLEPAVDKYGLTFPALRFLLGPDRGSELSLGALALRYAAVHLLTLAGLAGGGLVGLWSLPVRSLLTFGAHGPEPADACEGDSAGSLSFSPGRARRMYGGLLAGYVGFLVYGCLLPLDLVHLPLPEALDEFVSLISRRPAIARHSDAVTNVLMYIPVPFLALGAWTAGGSRPWRAYMIPPLVVAAGLLSLLLEFIQVYVPARIVSYHDLIAQGVGLLIGLGGWFVAGPGLTRWTARLTHQGPGARRARMLLAAYAVLFLVYQVSPLRLSIRLGRLARKYRDGMINLVPFADPVTLSPHPLLIKTALYVPIGFLLMLYRPRDRHPLRTALVFGILFASALETLQIIVVQRMATATDIVLGTVGVMIGAALAWTVGPLARGPGLDRPGWRRYGKWIKLSAIGFWLMAMVWKRWAPFEFHPPPQGALAALADVLTTPPLDIVRRLDLPQGLARLAREAGVVFLLGLLVQSLAAGSRPRRALATLVAVALFLVLEIGRLWMGRYRPDLTLLIIGLLSAVGSYLAYPAVVATFLKTPPEDDPASALPAERTSRQLGDQPRAQ